MLSITLPAGAAPGTIVQAPDGSGGTVQVQLPHGCAPGATVQVPLPAAPAALVAPVAPVAPAPAPAGTDLTAEQRAALDAFAAMDADGDGELTADEIYQALSKNDAELTLARVQEIVAKADADGNGTVSRQEYLDAVAADIVPGSWLGGLGRRLGALFAEPAAAAAAAPPREEATPPPPPDPASPAVVVTEPEPAVAPDPASPVVAAEPAAAGKPGRKLSFKERAASKKKELGKAAARAKEAALKTTRIKDPFVERLFDGCVVWSQDWKRDLWLYLKTKNPFISTLFSHPDHPYSPAERRNGLVLGLLYALGIAFLFEANVGTGVRVDRRRAESRPAAARAGQYGQTGTREYILGRDPQHGVHLFLRLRGRVPVRAEGLGRLRQVVRRKVRPVYLPHYDRDRRDVFLGRIYPNLREK